MSSEIKKIISFWVMILVIIGLFCLIYFIVLKPAIDKSNLEKQQNIDCLTPIANDYCKNIGLEFVRIESSGWGSPWGMYCGNKRVTENKFYIFLDDEKRSCGIQ